MGSVWRHLRSGHTVASATPPPDQGDIEHHDLEGVVYAPHEPSASWCKAAGHQEDGVVDQVDVPVAVQVQAEAINGLARGKDRPARFFPFSPKPLLRLSQPGADSQPAHAVRSESPAA